MCHAASPLRKQKFPWLIGPCDLIDCLVMQTPRSFLHDRPKVRLGCIDLRQVRTVKGDQKPVPVRDPAGPGPPPTKKHQA
jgi:hypothetical protein